MENNKIYPDSFNELFSKNYTCNEYEKFIGQGNPASKILIIAKEWGMEKTDPAYIYGIKENFRTWRDMRHPDVKNWFDAHWNWSAYHPRQPYKGQLLLKDNKNTDISLNNKGTSLTCCAYQKFINKILPKDLQVKKGEQLNFYDYCFITELSSNCMPKSRKNDDTKKSIETRLSSNGILAQPFFRNFPVVIMAIYHYIDWYNDIPIIHNFDGGVLNYEYKGIIVSEDTYSKYDEETKKRMPLFRTNNNFSKGNFINVHESADKKHILLHTNHFVDNSRPRSDVWMNELADIIRPYLNI